MQPVTWHYTHWNMVHIQHAHSIIKCNNTPIQKKEYPFCARKLWTVKYCSVQRQRMAWREMLSALLVGTFYLLITLHFLFFTDSFCYVSFCNYLCFIQDAHETHVNLRALIRYLILSEKCYINTSRDLSCSVVVMDEKGGTKTNMQVKWKIKYIETAFCSWLT